MNQHMLDLTSTLLEIYKKNLNFLKDNFIDVYERIEQLSSEINLELYRPKYSLECIGGYFDIFNIDNSSWYYGVDSYLDADHRAMASNFSRDGSLDLLRKGVDGISFSNGSDIGAAIPIINYINENIDSQNIEFEKIYKFIFVGTGLGIHIGQIYKKLKPYTTLIIEPEIEVFRLSLFVTDYTEFQKQNHKLFLCIGDSRAERIKSLDHFYGHHDYMNYNVKHHLLIENDRYIMDEIVEYFSINTPTAFPYLHTITNVQKNLKYAHDGYKFLNYTKVSEARVLRNKKILIIAAGPSLDEYMDWIQINQSKFVIICVDVILKKLEKHNIIPDIVFSIDPSYLCANYLTTVDRNFLDNTAIIFLAQQHPDVLKIVKKQNSYIAQSMPLFGELGFMGTVTNVGTYSYMMAVRLGANEIYTIGNDAAFNQLTGNRYAEDSSCLQSETLDIEPNGSSMISVYDILEVKGNLKETVKTNRSLLAFKDSFETTTYDLKKEYNFEVYNLSDGVFLEGFIPMTKNEINKNISHFYDKSSNIKRIMDSVSEVLVSEKINFFEDKKVISEMIKAVEKHKDLKIRNFDQFMKKKIDLMIFILESSKSMQMVVFWRIFLLYIELVDVYINFMFNLKQKDLYDQKHLKRVNVMWCDGLLDVLRGFKSICSNS
jgi:hypothetical protein